MFFYQVTTFTIVCHCGFLFIVFLIEVALLTQVMLSPHLYNAIFRSIGNYGGVSHFAGNDMEDSSDAIATDSHLIWESYLQDFFLMLEIYYTNLDKTEVVVMKQREIYAEDGYEVANVG